jgi:spore coat polysaccharide biosynthesis predicted glycosyltransferase SpsG
MRYVLRADSSPKSGSGHVMRLSAIAEELIARDERVTFIGKVAELPWLALRINKLGFSQILESSAGYLPNPATDVLILDSYTLPVDDSFIQPDNWRRVVTISDEPTPPYLADLVIHPAISEGWKPNSDVKFFSGPRYIPFRKSIVKFKSDPKDHQDLEILVVGGGADPFDFVESIAKSIMSVQGQFHAVLFSNNSSLAKLDYRFTCIPIGPELDVYADSAELVFTTASTTSLEFIAREIALGIGCAVDNQKEYYKSLTQNGVAVPIGELSNEKWELDDQRISEMIHSKTLRENLIENSRGMLDLYGVTRIVDEITKI